MRRGRDNSLSLPQTCFEENADAMRENERASATEGQIVANNKAGFSQRWYRGGTDVARRKRVGFPGAIYHVMFFRTPQPNLSRGMQTLLGGYASWWNQKYREVGHLFQGRFKSRLVENEGYFWTVSRYVHLNPGPALCSLSTR